MDHEIRNFKVLITETLGSVSAEVMIPSSMQAMMVLSHGAGAGMDHRFMISLSRALADVHIGSLRYNFLYMERGKKVPDPPSIAEKTVAQVIDRAIGLFPDTPILAGGKSFGGRMTSQFLSKHLTAVVGIVFFGFPLHPVHQPGTDRAVHLQQINIPMLFLQGTRDALAYIDLMKNVCLHLPYSTLQEFEGADHSFKKGKKEYIPELAQATEAWFKSRRVKK